MEKFKKRSMFLGYNCPSSKSRGLYESSKLIQFRTDRITHKVFHKTGYSHLNKENQVPKKSIFDRQFNKSCRNASDVNIRNSFYANLDRLVSQVEVFESYKRSIQKHKALSLF